MAETARTGQDGPLRAGRAGGRLAAGRAELRLAAGRVPPRLLVERAGVLDAVDPDFDPFREPVATLEAPPLPLVVRAFVRVAM